MHALRGVSLRIERGDFVAIMGSSGSGKSTLMNTLGCLDAPTRGRYLLDGIDVRRMDEDDLSDLRNRKIGFVFQSFNLVRARARSRTSSCRSPMPASSRAQRRRARRAALGAVGMADRMQHLPSELSGGQQQRVAVARALVTNPSLDPRRRADRQPRLALDRRRAGDLRAAEPRGRTIVLITHEPDVAAQAKRVIRLADGGSSGRAHAGVHERPRRSPRKSARRPRAPQARGARHDRRSRHCGSPAAGCWPTSCAPA